MSQTGMGSLRRLYDSLILALAVAAAASIGFITLAIVADVILRNLGFRPFQWTSAVVEYVLLFVTMAGGPWVVRTGGHVAINSFVDALPAGARQTVGRIVLTLSIVILGILGWRAGVLALGQYQRGAVDMRSIDIPGWISYTMLSGGFTLMAVEVARLLARGEFRVGDKAAH